MFLYPCKDRDKDKVGDRPAKLNEKESDRELAREKKANDKIFLLEEKHENFVVAVRKWEVLAATKVKMSGCEKRVNRGPFLEAPGNYRAR